MISPTGVLHTVHPNIVDNIIIKHALSDHPPILTIIKIKHIYKLQQYRHTYTNYKKADWTTHTKDTEAAFSDTRIPTQQTRYSPISSYKQTDTTYRKANYLKITSFYCPVHITTKLTHKKQHQ